MSTSAASRRCPAMLFPRSTTLRAAWSTAVPPRCIEREPPWPPPSDVASVSAWRKAMRCGAVPNSAAAIWARLVSCPWPFDCVPTESSAGAAEIGDGVDAQADDAGLVVEPEPHRGDEVARVRVRHEGAGAVVHPFHGAPE